VNRKSSVITVCVLLFSLCSSADAQQTVKISRIGVLTSGISSAARPRIQAFQQRLRELGYVEGKNIIIEQRYAEGKF
jgi:putative tryptophan/tyrosine transport system substrate-binding protein